MKLTYRIISFVFLLIITATAAADLPRYEPGVLYLPNKAIALGNFTIKKVTICPSNNFNYR